MRRLQSAKKLWKVFTRMLKSKLHKLNRSRTIKKPPKTLGDRTRKAVPWPILSIQPHRFKKVQNLHFNPSQKVRHHHHGLQKRPSPVYIDQLFLEPTTKEHAQVSTKDITATSPAGTCHEVGSANETMHTADDMWESLVLTSPQMHGINERAEEFIARFRAEMQLQEMLARR